MKVHRMDDVRLMYLADYYDVYHLRALEYVESGGMQAAWGRPKR